MKAERILKIISMDLQDFEPGFEPRWPWIADSEAGRYGLIDYINNAVTDIAAQRPDLTAVTEPVLLEPGMRQWLPSRARHCATKDAVMLFNISRNMGSDGRSPGPLISPSWPDLLLAWNISGKCGRVVECFAYDRTQDAKTYLVFPAVPESGEVWVEATYSAKPEPIICPGDEIGLPDAFAPAIQHHVLSAIFAGDNEASSMQKAVYHKQLYDSILGMKTQTDMSWPFAKSALGRQ